MLGALAMLSIGSSLTRPPHFGLLSNLTARTARRDYWVAQSAGSLLVFSARLCHLLFSITCAIAVPDCTAVLLQLQFRRAKTLPVGPGYDLARADLASETG